MSIALDNGKEIGWWKVGRMSVVLVGRVERIHKRRLELKDSRSEAHHVILLPWLVHSPHNLFHQIITEKEQFIIQWKDVTIDFVLDFRHYCRHGLIQQLRFLYQGRDHFLFTYEDGETIHMPSDTIGNGFRNLRRRIGINCAR